MAKQPEFAVSSVIVPVSRIAWFPELNLARQTGNFGTTAQLNVLRDSLATDGWRMNGDGEIDIEPMSADQKVEWDKRQTAEWERLKLAAVANPVNGGVELKVWEEMFTDGKKLLSADFYHISGNRRRSQLFAANVLRRLHVNEDGKPDPLPLILEVKAQITKFKDATERLNWQLKENLDKTEGFFQMSLLDKLLGAKTQVELGGNQASVRKVFKDGTGIKLWGIIILNARFPELKIIDRMKKDPNDPEFINISSIDFKVMQKYTARTDVEKLAETREKKAAELRAEGKTQEQVDYILDMDYKPATQKEIADYFGGERPVGNANKTMSKDLMKSLSEQNPNVVVKDVCKMFLTNNTDVIKKYLGTAVGHNALVSIADDNDYPFVETILTNIEKLSGDARVEYLKKLLAVS